MTCLARAIDGLNEWLGRICSWLALFMVLMTCFNVVQRYLFDSGLPWQQELVLFMHGILFLGGASYALKHEALVRVDVLYHNFCERRKAWVNLIGTIVFLFPVSAALIYFSSDYVKNSWAIYEGSAEYLGMPGVFLFKSFIWVAGGALILQGIATIIHSLNIVLGREHILEEAKDHYG